MKSGSTSSAARLDNSLLLDIIKDETVRITHIKIVSELNDIRKKQYLTDFTPTSNEFR